MDSKTEILTFQISDIRVGVLTSRLDSLNISYELKETTAYMESAYELKVNKENVLTVDSILNEITNMKTTKVKSGLAVGKDSAFMMAEGS